MNRPDFYWGGSFMPLYDKGIFSYNTFVGCCFNHFA
ncbi:hypothetical protein MMC2321_05192 [Chitinophaga sp. MM2321]